MNAMLVEIFENYYHHSLANFMEAMTDRELIFRASSLYEILHDEDEVNYALNKAMRVCNNCGLPIQEHFKAIYTAHCAEHSIELDWKLSKLAYVLSIVNGNPENPIVGKMQTELIKRLF
ncbi:MAG: hypothetical protein R2764_21460 [Bacteroidales bacterium]